MPVNVENKRLMIDGKAVPLLSGEVHYWRLEREAWRPILESVKDAGLEIVATYVPWRVHEPVRGQIDFGEGGNASLDLAAFLALCREVGLYVFLRPGPLIVSEMKHGGLPDWLFEDPSILTHNAKGEVPRFGSFADAGNPCYLHPEYLAIARSWLTRVNDVARPYFHTHGGPIVMVQLDNEVSLICLDGYLTSDYNPAIVGPGGLYQQWLERKYGTVDAIPYAEKPAAFDEIQPPRELPESIQDDLFRHFDWAEYKEDYMADYVAALREIHRADGLATELFAVNYNVHRPLDMPNNWYKIEQATGGGITGLDYYKRPFLTFEGFQKTAMGARYSCAVTKLPWSPEWMCGIWGEDFGGDGVVGPEHTEFLYLVGLAYGLVGFNHYMFAERESWAFCPVNDFGQRRYNFDAIRRMSAIHKELDPPALEFDSRVGLLNDRQAARLGYIEEGFPARDDQVQLGQQFVDGTRNGETNREYEGLFSLLLQLGHVPTLIAPEVNFADARKVEVLLVPCQERMRREILEEIYAVAADGVRVVFDPAPPTMDWSGSPLGLVPPAGAEIVSTGGRFAQRTYEEEQKLAERKRGFVSPFGAESEEQLRRMEQLLDDTVPAIRTGDRFMPVTLARDGRRHVLFAMNLHIRARKIAIELPFRCRALKDLKTGERIPVENGRATFPIDCKQGRILRAVR